MQVLKIKNKFLKIAIDGTAASGKGTLGKRLSKTLSLPYLDTGTLYRETAFLYLKKNKTNDSNFNIDADILNDILNKIKLKNINSKTLNNDIYGTFASKIARFTIVRNKLREMQLEYAHKMCNEFGGCILDGRDIGTIVMPNANFKFYIDAPVEVRAKRRYEQLSLNQKSVDYHKILKNLKIRDSNDKNRDNSPLKLAKDSIFIDTGLIKPNEVEEKALSYINEKNK